MEGDLSRAKARAALMHELENALRRGSAQGAIFGQTVANTVGISGSDLECLDFLNLEGRVTAGRLAEVTGLTTGAITGVIDRLEKAAMVRRERDPDDRRKVFIATIPENVARVGRFYEHMQRGMVKLWETYSDAELRLLVGFATKGYETMLAATEELKSMVDAPTRTPQEKAEKKPVKKARPSGSRKPSRTP
jgi:DNA-binding MarR family transcriptional regulator